MAGAVLIRAIAALGSSPSELRLFVYDHKTIRPHVASVLGADALHWFDGNYTPCVKSPYRCMGTDPEFADGVLTRELPLAIRESRERPVKIVSTPDEADGVLWLVWEYALCVASGTRLEPWEHGKKVVFASCSAQVQLFQWLQTTPRWQLRGGGDFAFLVPMAQYWQRVRGGPAEYLTEHHKWSGKYFRELHQKRFVERARYPLASVGAAADTLEKITRRSIHLTIEDLRRVDDIGSSRTVLLPYYCLPKLYYEQAAEKAATRKRYLASFIGTIEVRNCCERCNEGRKDRVYEPGSAHLRPREIRNKTLLQLSMGRLFLRLDERSGKSFIAEAERSNGAKASGARRFLVQPLDSVSVERNDRNGLESAGVPFGDAMRTSVFCLIPRGDTASTKRFYAAILSGCVPVVISDEFLPAFAPLLPEIESAFVRIPEAAFLTQSFSLPAFLKSLQQQPERLEKLVAAGRSLRRSFTYVRHRPINRAHPVRSAPDATDNVASVLIRAFAEAAAELDENGLCTGMADEGCSLAAGWADQADTAHADVRAACSSQAVAESCMRTCCRKLQCAWVAQRPETRCNLLLNDGRTAGEACLDPVGHNGAPSDFCRGHAASTASRPLDLPVYWIAKNDSAPGSAALRRQLERVAATTHTRIAAVTRAQARDAIKAGQLFLMSWRLTDEHSSILPPAPPTTAAARFDADAAVPLSAVALSLSHLQAIRTAYDAGHEKVVILEEGVSLRSALSWPFGLTRMTSTSETPGGEWGLLQLVSHGKGFLEKTMALEQPFFVRGPDAWRAWDIERDTSSAGYVITRAAMAELLRYTHTTFSGTRWLATPVHVDKLLFGYLRRRVYTRNWPLLFFQDHSGMIDSGAAKVNAMISRHLDTHNMSSSLLDPMLVSRDKKADPWSYIHSFRAQGDDDDDDDFTCHHHARIKLPCVSKSVCPVPGWVVTLEACKRRCCATPGCAAINHNTYSQCFLRRLDGTSKFDLEADSVRHRSVTCRRADSKASCKSAAASIVAGPQQTTTTPQPSPDLLSGGAGTCSLTQHKWLLVLSTGRSGSTTVLQMLRQLPGVEMSGEHAGMLQSFRDLAERLAVTTAHAEHEAKSQDPDYSWTGQAPISRKQLLCLAQAWFVRATQGPAGAPPPAIRGWKEVRYATRADLDFIAEVFPGAQFIINYRMTPAGFEQTAVDHFVKQVRFTASRQDEATRNLTAWADQHASRAFRLPLEQMNTTTFTEIAKWIGLPECKATRMLHFNKQGWSAYAKGKAWKCAKSSMG